MTETIGVQIQPQDQQFIATTLKAAAAMEKLAAQEKQVAAAAEKLGVDGKKFAQAFAKEESKRVADERKATAQAAADQRKADKTKEQEEKKRKAALDKQAKAKQKFDADYKAASASQLAEGAAVLGATVAFEAAVVAAGVAVLDLAKDIGQAALKAVELRENARGFFNVLTAGRGDKTLALVDSLATQLGVHLNDARQQFIEFRQAGLNNKQSAQLIKLAADLNTVDHSGELAKQAIARVLSYTSPNGVQTADQAEASARAMKLLAKQAGVAGDGTQAAAEAAGTLVGALNRLDNKKTAVLETIGERIKPSVDKAATAVANLVERFVDSKRGQAVIDGVARGISGIADAVTAAVPYVAKLGDALQKGAANPVVQFALDGLVGLLKVGAVVAGAFAAGAALLVAPIVAVGAAATAAVVALGTLVQRAPAALAKAVPAMYEAGKQMVSGLIHGLEDSAARLAQSVSDLAGNAAKAFKEKLGIHSPSKVFEQFGVHIGTGTQRGVERSMPRGGEIASLAFPPANTNAVSAPSFALGGRGGGAPSVHVTIENINVPAGDVDPDRWARALSRQLGSELQAILLTQGAPDPAQTRAA